MKFKLSIRGILNSEAISYEELADLLFADLKFPKSALRRLIAMPDTITLSQVESIADKLSMSIDALVKNSYIYELLDSKLIQKVCYTNKIAFISTLEPSAIVLIKDFSGCTLQDIKYSIFKITNVQHENLKNTLLNLIKQQS